MPLRISGIGFEVCFSPELQSAETMAIKFCTEQAGILKLKEEELSGCVTNVGNYLLNEVNAWYVEKTFQTPMTLNGQVLDVSFIPETTSVESMTERICKSNVEPSIFTECVEKVLVFLRAQLAAFYAEKTLVVPLKIEDIPFDITFLPERHSTRDISVRICNENAETFKLTAETIPSCVKGTQDALERAVTTWVASKTLDFNLTVNRKVYPFSMIPERQTATQAARSFCLQHNEDFGFNAENIAAECVSPIANEISQVIKGWITSKEVTVVVNMGNGESANVSYMPGRQTSLTAATRFCVRNGAALGFTNETVQQGCIDRLVKALSEEAAKKQSQQVTASAEAA